MSRAVAELPGTVNEHSPPASSDNDSDRMSNEATSWTGREADESPTAIVKTFSTIATPTAR